MTLFNGYVWQRPQRRVWLVVCMAILILLGLGIWQLQRLEWKNNLIAHIARANEREPLQNWPQSPKDASDFGWRRVQLSGVFLHDKEMWLAARYHEGQLGFHILTPFLLDDGRVVLLNRGWVPNEKKEASARLEGQVGGAISLLAQIRTDRDQNPFTPEADVAKNIWFWRDITKMRTATGLELEPITADVIHMLPPGGFPIASSGDIRLPNDHLGYALTWFSLALAAAVMAVLYHLKPLEPSQ